MLAYRKLSAIFDDAAALVAAVAQAADTVDPADRVMVLADEPDDCVLEAAAAGRADLIGYGTYGNPAEIASSRAALVRDRRSLIPLGFTGLVFGTGCGFVLGTRCRPSRPPAIRRRE